jgi:hypothetical protein
VTGYLKTAELLVGLKGKAVRSIKKAMFGKPKGIPKMI